MKILFATTNKAKVKFYATRLKEKGLDLVTLSDMGITQEFEETGNTPLENAIIKATGYAAISKMPTIAIDDGLYLDTIPDELQPSVHVRRINGKRLTDNEMIEYYIGLVNQYGTNGELKGYFTKGIALVYGDHVQTFQKDAKRVFTNKRSEVINEGYPLASIQILPTIHKFKSELTREEEASTMDIEHQSIFDFLFQAMENLEQVHID